MKVLVNDQPITSQNIRLLNPLGNWLSGQDQTILEFTPTIFDGHQYLGTKLDTKRLNLRFLVEDNEPQNKILDIQRLRQAILPRQKTKLQLGDLLMVDNFDYADDANANPIYTVNSGNAEIVGANHPSNFVRYQGIGSMYVGCNTSFSFTANLPRIVYGYQIKEGVCCKGCPYSAYIRLRNCGGFPNTGTLTLSITDGVGTATATATITPYECRDTCKWIDIKFGSFTGDSVSRITGYTLSGTFSESVSFWLDALTLQDCMNVTALYGAFDKLIDADPSTTTYSDVSADFFVENGFGELVGMEWVDVATVDKAITIFNDILPQPVAFRAKTDILPLSGGSSIESISLTNDSGGSSTIVGSEIGDFDDDYMLRIDHFNGNISKSNVIASRIPSYGSAINMYQHGIPVNLIINDGSITRICGSLATPPYNLTNTQNTKVIDNIRNFFVPFVPSASGNLSFIDLQIAGGSVDGQHCVVMEADSTGNYPAYSMFGNTILGKARSLNKIKFGNNRTLKRFFFKGLNLVSGQTYFFTLNPDYRPEHSENYNYIAYNDATAVPFTGHTPTKTTFINTGEIGFGGFEILSATETPVFQVYADIVGSYGASHQVRRVLNQLV